MKEEHINEDDDFFSYGVCDNCEQTDLIGCWDNRWICEDCYIEELNIEQ